MNGIVEQNEARYAGPCKPHYEFRSLCSSNGKPLKRTLMITFERGKFFLAAVWRTDGRALPECQAFSASIFQIKNCALGMGVILRITYPHLV